MKSRSLQCGHPEDSIRKILETEISSDELVLIKKVVVAVDLTKHSEATAHYAAQIAKWFNASLYIGPVFVHCGVGQRVCSFSFADSGVDADSIFEKARELGFPLQDEKLRAFLRSLKD